jgi:peptidoglycan glycosyltransferase
MRERQPGSALKPFTYLTAMEQGMTPVSLLWDVPTEFPTGSNPPWYAPENYNKRWNGPVRMRTALANSLNMPAVKALRFAGLQNMLDLLDRVGIKSGLKRGPEHYGLSLTLGGGEVTLLELTTAYNTLASRGHYFEPTPILKITDNDGNIIEEYQPSSGVEAVDPALVAIITDMLSDDQARQPIWGLNSRLKLSQPAAVKTGTSEDWRDAWTVGYTPFVTVGVWSGNNNNEQTFKVESLQGGGIIWHNVMEELFDRIDEQPDYAQLFATPFAADEPPTDFTTPEDGSVVSKSICALPGPFGRYTEELFTTSMLTSEELQTDKKVGCETHQNVRVVRYYNAAGNARYCRPARGQNYPGGAVRVISSWDLPEEDPDIRVQYTWSGGSAGGGIGYIPVCTSDLSLRPPATSTPAPTEVPEAPIAGAVQMPSVVGLGENQAKAVLARAGIRSIQVDYQTRERIPATFDQFGPYVVLSSIPAPGTWIMPGTTVVLGVRSPDDSQPAVQPTSLPESIQPTAPPAPPVSQPTTPPTQSQPAPTAPAAPPVEEQPPSRPSAIILVPTSTGSNVPVDIQP